MYGQITKKLFFYNSLFFFFFLLLFLSFPELDIFLSKLFFIEKEFISEKYIFIKYLRSFLKDFMIIIPILAILILLTRRINRIQKIKMLENSRIRFFLIGLILGPAIGCGLIANLYFKDTWGRARPVHVEEFGGDKIFTPAFVKSDQCERNCSWISGETSAAFSFVVGTILMKNPLFLTANFILGFLVFFCRMAMGGHFFSDNIFAMIFMIYLAILYKNLIFFCIKKKIFYEKNTRYNR